jgi:hypothetical protein
VRIGSAYVGRLAGVAIVSASCAYVAVVSPDSPGHYPSCQFREITHLYCPGCGTLRCAHSFFHGDLGAALRDNALAVVAAPILLIWAATWFLGKPKDAIPARFAPLVPYVVMGFAIVRNLPVPLVQQLMVPAAA